MCLIVKEVRKGPFPFNNKKIFYDFLRVEWKQCFSCTSYTQILDHEGKPFSLKTLLFLNSDEQDLAFCSTGTKGMIPLLFDLKYLLTETTAWLYIGFALRRTGSGPLLILDGFSPSKTVFPLRDESVFCNGFKGSFSILGNAVLDFRELACSLYPFSFGIRVKTCFVSKRKKKKAFMNLQTVVSYFESVYR